MILLDQFKAVAARRHLARRAVECYGSWVRQFLAYHRSDDGAWRHPPELRGPDVAAFLTH
jgi:hypothetical protein